MASKKPSSRAKQIANFKSQLGGMDDIFEREDNRRTQDEMRRENARRNKACESKNAYDSRGEAQAAIAACEEHGVRNLRCYKCPYCGKWHLTSKPQKDER
ncbi:MAG: hypothetical protein ACOYIK_10845 [Coriobacteriales bacterium]|jgi:hypothetical protein